MVLLQPLRRACLAGILLPFCAAALAEEAAFVPPQMSRCAIRVTAAKVLNQFTGKSFLAIDLEPSFVLTVEFLDDCPLLGKKAGEQAHLGFHSVAQSFGEPFGEVNGRTYTVEVTRMVIEGRVRFNIRRAPDAKE